MSFAQSTAKALGPTTYTPHALNQIQLRRQRTRKGGIGIDRLLSLAGISDSVSVYPPSSRDAFVQLVGEIENGSASEQFKSRAIFYLFLDFSDPESLEITSKTSSSKKATIAGYYASQIWMSISEQALIGALWFLDRGVTSEKALELLGQPFDLYRCDTLNEYIVAALADQKVNAVSGYLATLASPDRFVDEQARSLILKGKFAEVLSLSRQQGNNKYLADMARSAVESKPMSMELVQQAFTANEWKIVNEELMRIILMASPTLGDANATSVLAYNILLVRALHVGDIEALKELRSSGELAELLVSKYMPYEGESSRPPTPHIFMYDN